MRPFPELKTNAILNHPDGRKIPVFTRWNERDGLTSIFYGSKHGASDRVYTHLLTKAE